MNKMQTAVVASKLEMVDDYVDAVAKASPVERKALHKAFWDDLAWRLKIAAVELSDN